MGIKENLYEQYELVEDSNLLLDLLDKTAYFKGIKLTLQNIDEFYFLSRLADHRGILVEYADLFKFSTDNKEIYNNNPKCREQIRQSCLVQVQSIINSFDEIKYYIIEDDYKTGLILTLDRVCVVKEYTGDHFAKLRRSLNSVEDTSDWNKLHVENNNSLLPKEVDKIELALEITEHQNPANLTAEYNEISSDQTQAMLKSNSIDSVKKVSKQPVGSIKLINNGKTILYQEDEDSEKIKIPLGPVKAQILDDIIENKGYIAKLGRHLKYSTKVKTEEKRDGFVYVHICQLNEKFRDKTNKDFNLIDFNKENKRYELIVELKQ